MKPAPDPTNEDDPNQECDEPESPDTGEAKVDGGQEKIIVYTPVIEADLNDPAPPVAKDFSITHKIVTHNSAPARDLEGTLELNLVEGNADELQLFHWTESEDGIQSLEEVAFMQGSVSIPVVEPGHSGCGDHIWHGGSETFVAVISGSDTYVIEATVDPAQGEPEPGMTATVHLLPVEIVPDFNRDGQIDTAGSTDRHKVDDQNPYRFWINDDDDSGEIGNGDIPGSASPNHDTLLVDGVGDLLDWFPLFLDFKQLLEVLPADKYTYWVKHEDAKLNLVETDLTPSESGAYLTDLSVAQSLISGGQQVNITSLNATGIPLDQEFLDKIKNEGKGVILVEGRGETTKPLVVEVTDSQTGESMTRISFPLSIQGVEQMFRHKNLLAAGGGSGGPPDRLDEPQNFPDSLSSGKTFVLVHGYNVNPESARGWGAEMFKRLYWTGSKAKFYNVSWYGYETQVFGSITTDYQANVDNAFATAHSLATFLGTLNNVNVAAHSLGNMLVGSAIHDWGADPSSYFMIDAAVAKESYDGTEEQLTSGGVMGMEHPYWASYERRVWCSDWHQLPFAAGDHRSNLTWKNRLENVSSVTAYNFYSTGEEVLRNPSSYPNLPLSANEVWNNQERMKGRMLTGQVLSSNYGGWEVGDYWDVEDTFDDPSDSEPPETIMRHRYPSETGAISNEQLKANPFFEPGPAELYGANGSAYASPQQHRNSLLAEMVPALSFAAGSNALEGFGEGANFNMMSLKNGWPQERLNQNNPNWMHSDIKVVAYGYVYPVFQKIVELGDLAK